MAKETDFDKEDAGGYKAPEAREKIVEALEAIHYQSAKHLVKNSGVSIDDVMEIDRAIGADDEIASELVGGITVYFLKENKPEGRLYNTGENSFAVKSSEDEPAAKKRVPPVRKSKVTPETVEELAFEGLDIPEAAIRFGISPNTARLYLGTIKPRLDLFEAWKRGKERRKQLVASLSPAKVETKSEEKMNRDHYEFNEKEIHKSCGYVKKSPACEEANQPASGDEKVNLSRENLAEILELSDEQFEQKFNLSKELMPPIETEENFLEIPDRQIALRERQPVLSSFTIAVAERVPQGKTGSSDFPFEFSNQVESVPAHYRSVTLSNGKKIFMSDDINIFDLKPHEAKFCAAIVELIDEFESAAK
ncbi:MAG TPA: hypothetical protein VIL74_20835 [Pyrinomonadaceae bacterium]|jgi:hypothetical protein